MKLSSQISERLDEQSIGPADKNIPKWLVAVVGIVVVFVIGFADYITGYEISFSIFYFIPIMFVTWYGNFSLGGVISVLSAILWMLCDVYSGHKYSNEIIPYWNSFMRLCIFAIVTYLLSSIRSYSDKVKYSSRQDSLTGIGNSSYFYAAANSELERLRRYGRIFSLVYIDLDNFKTINDTNGHNTGDNLLRLVAATLRDNIRAIDTVARLGGDEFAILLPEISSDDAVTAMTRIRAAVTQNMERNNWAVTCSIGIATFRSTQETVDQIIGKADSLMYEVKNSGKNNIRSKEF